MASDHPSLKYTVEKKLVGQRNQLGYRTINEDGFEFVEPINLEIQVTFENALARFRQR